MTPRALSGARRSVLGAPLDAFTYRSLVYLALAAPIGIAYTVVLSVGVGLTLGLGLTPFGPVVVPAALLAVVSLAWVDGHITGGLLGVDISPGFPDPDQGVFEFVKELVVGRATWTGAAFLLWRAVLGFVSLTVLVAGVSVTVALLLAPLAYGDALAIRYQFGAVPIDAFGKSLVAAIVGVGTGLGTLYVVNVLGRASALVADALLGDHDSTDADHGTLGD